MYKISVISAFLREHAWRAVPLLAQSPGDANGRRGHVKLTFHRVDLSTTNHYSPFQTTIKLNDQNDKTCQL